MQSSHKYSKSIKTSSYDLRSFKLDRQDDSWLEQLRFAERPLPMGRLGDYELIAEVDRGGQGVVYRAIQPGTQRPIALKRLIGGSMATESMRRRFEREMEAAASLSHPHLVTVYGVEIVDDQPILAMEWIDGQPVTRWAGVANGTRRTVGEIIALFTKICDALHHAHQHGVIHRDLKPSNILVDGSDQPHVVDFGLAKLITAGNFYEQSLTLTAQFVGTLAYAAPEQLSGRINDVDVRSDVYALGVILYELLTGWLPTAAHASLPEMVRSIEEGTPTRPSHVNSSLSAELDAIVLKALEKEPHRRYQSVDAMGEDLKRYLRGEAVLAHPPTIGYQLRTLMRRHKLATALVSVIAVLVVGFGLLASVLWQEASSAQRSEAKSRRVAEQTNEFLHEMLSSGRPDASGRDVTVRTLLDEAAGTLQTGSFDSSEVEASVRLTLGISYSAIGRYTESIQQLLACLDLHDSQLNSTDVERAVILLALGRSHTLAGQYDLARAYLQESLQIFRVHDNTEPVYLARALNALAAVEGILGNSAVAEDLYAQSLELCIKYYGVDDAETARVMNNMGKLLLAQGDFDEGVDLLERALDIHIQQMGPEHPDTMDCRSNLASALLAQDDYDTAETVFRKVLQRDLEVFGENHPEVAVSHSNLGMTLLAKGMLEDAKAHLLTALDISRRELGSDHPSVANRAHNLGKTLMEQGELLEAEALFREALLIRESKLPAKHFAILGTKSRLGYCLLKLGRLDEAEPLLVQSYQDIRETMGEEDETTAVSVQRLIELYDLWGKADQAASYRALLPE